MKDHPKLNAIAVWSRLPLSLSSRLYVGGRSFLDGEEVKFPSRKAPLVRYAKGYERFGLRFSLFVFSDNTDEDEVEEKLDDFAKKLKKTDVTEALAEGFNYKGEL